MCHELANFRSKRDIVTRDASVDEFIQMLYRDFRSHLEEISREKCDENERTAT